MSKSIQTPAPKFPKEGSHKDFQTKKGQQSTNRVLDWLVRDWDAQHKRRLAAHEKIVAERKLKQHLLIQQQQKVRLDALRELSLNIEEEEKVLQQVLTELREKLDPIDFQKYLAKTKLLLLGDGQARLYVPNLFIATWVDKITPT